MDVRRVMRIVWIWEWHNTMDVVVRLDEGVGEVLRRFSKDGHEVWITTLGGPVRGIDQGINFLLVPKYTSWATQIAELNPDLILGWGTVDHKIYQQVHQLLPEIPMYMFLAGGSVDHPYAHSFNGFFVETNFHVKDLNARGLPAWRALGVMEDILFPTPEQHKIWDVFLPASFTTNKRYDLWCDVIEQSGLKGVAVGPVNELGCQIECRKVGVPTFGYMSRTVLRDFYNASRVTLLTAGAWGGCQRALLESLACGIPVVTTEDNFQLDWINSTGAPVVWCPPQVNLLIEAVKKVIDSPPDPKVLRQFVLDNFTGNHYYEVVRQVVLPQEVEACQVKA